MTRLAGACVVALLVAACSSGGDGARDTTTTRATARPTTTAAEPIVDMLDPSTVLVADGVRFGTAPPPLSAALEAFADDPFVLDSAVAVAWSEQALDVIAEVAVLALDPEAFADEELFDVYVEELHDALSERAEVVHGFQHENLVTVLFGSDAARVENLARLMQQAVAAGRTGSDARSTPMREIPPGSVFVALATARFDPLIPPPPATGTTSTTSDPPPAPPVIPGAGGQLPDGRRVVVAEEERAIAWAIAVPTATLGSAEQLEAAIAEMLAQRGAVATAYIGDRTVWSVEPGGDQPGVRAFRHANVAVVVEARDAVQLDALVSEWISALA